MPAGGAAGVQEPGGEHGAGGEVLAPSGTPPPHPRQHAPGTVQYSIV